MIRIINNSTFGYWNGTSVEPKKKGDTPFTINPKREAELVAAGIAEYVDAMIIELDKDFAEIKDFEISKEYLETLKLEQLKEIAKQFNVDFKFGTKKVDFIEEIIAAAIAESVPAVPADEEESAEDMPVFDAAAMVI